MNKIICLFFSIILLSFLSASTLGISPAEIKISEKQNQIVCENFTIFAEGNSQFSGELKWSKEDSKNLNEYTLSSEELNINASFPKEIRAGKYQICISAKNKKNYFGALIYKMKNSSYAIGTWVKLNISRDNSVQEIFSITGNAIKEFNYQKIFFFTPILFLIILIFLLYKSKKNRTEFNNI